MDKQRPNSLPNALQIRPLGSSSLPELFAKLRGLSHRVWLDSAVDHLFSRGRYSFLSADPVDWQERRTSQPDPWTDLAQQCERISGALPRDPSLPPFIGGLVAMIGYEASWWLEPILRCDDDVLAIAWGVYDWVIAVDHGTDQAWLLSTGMDANGNLDSERAQRRAAEVLQRLQSNPPGCHGATIERIPSDPTQVQSNFSAQSYQDAVAEVISRICRGESFQVNLAQHLTCPASCDSETLYQTLRRRSPAPYAAFFDLGQSQVLSSSPEGFLQVRDRCVTTCPIKGTVAATGDPRIDQQLAAELAASTKDRAENIMIVDLMRNDLSRVCHDDSVTVQSLCEVQRFQSVQHLVSTVTGMLRDHVTIAELLAACFPGGSITGAPKVEAMLTIRRLEGRSRGAYCGSIGYVSATGDADFNILIRTITQHDGRWTFPVGGGVTARSNPSEELAETWTKAKGILDAIGMHQELRR